MGFVANGYNFAYIYILLIKNKITMTKNLLLIKSQIRREIADNHMQIKSLQNSLKDYKTLATGEITRAEILDEIKWLENENIKLNNQL